MLVLQRQLLNPGLRERTQTGRYDILKRISPYQRRTMTVDYISFCMHASNFPRK